MQSTVSSNLTIPTEGIDMAWEYKAHEECEYCIRFGYTSIVKNGKLIKLCQEHFKSSRLGLL